MKLSLLVREECANHRRNGTCVFSGNQCPLTAAEPKPCPQSLACSRGEQPGPDDGDYFSRAVLPLVQVMPEYADAAAEYRVIAGGRVGKAVAVVQVGLCLCGAARQRRQRFCPACQHANRQATKHRSRAARRGTVKGR